MNLRNFISPALSSFFLIVGVATYITFFQAQPINTDVTTETIAPTSIATTTPTPSVSPTKTSVPMATTKVTTTPKPTTAPTAKPTPSCIITVAGAKYNVYALQKTHSGGNVFTCGSDMTSSFNSQHGFNYRLIARYKI